ncbi:MAG: NHL repeat-containing protein [Coriobacteriales bacterium]
MSEGLQVQGPDARSRRATSLLAVILVLLLLLLCGVGYFFVRVLVPAGAPETACVSEGMTWVRSIYGFGPSSDEQLLGPTDVAIAPDGRIYATDPQRARVLAFNPDGTFAGLVHTGAGGSGRGMLGRPAGITCDSRGNLYISDVVNGKILVFDHDYTFVREWPAQQALGMRVVDDKLYVRELGEVVIYTLDGIETARFGERGRGTGAVLEPTGGITADEKRVYVADALNQAVKVFSADGALLWSQPSTTATGGPTGTDERAAETTSSPVDLPQDVELDSSGQLYALDAFDFSIMRLDNATGKILGKWGTPGEKDGQFMYPTGLAYDAARDWFAVADTANNRVQIVRVEGTGGGVGQAVTRAMSSPFRVCAIPLVALLVGIAIILVTRKREEDRDEAGRGSGSLAAE